MHSRSRSRSSSTCSNLRVVRVRLEIEMQIMQNLDRYFDSLILPHYSYYYLLLGYSLLLLLQDFYSCRVIMRILHTSYIIHHTFTYRYRSDCLVVFSFRFSCVPVSGSGPVILLAGFELLAFFVLFSFRFSCVPVSGSCAVILFGRKVA